MVGIRFLVRERVYSVRDLAIKFLDEMTVMSVWQLKTSADLNTPGLALVTVVCPSEMVGGFLQLRHASKYSVYVLVCLLFAYLLNQLDRYALAVTSRPMAHDIHFGDKGCLNNKSFSFRGQTDLCNKVPGNKDKLERNKDRSEHNLFNIFKYLEICNKIYLPCNCDCIKCCCLILHKQCS